MEQRNYTREQVVGTLREGLEVLDEANVPAELRSIAFERALQLIASKRIEQAVPAGILMGGAPPARG